MTSAPLPPNEVERFADLLRHNILDTIPEQDFNEIVELASLLCGAEIALISLVDDRRQWFKAKVGIADHETPREFAFCAHAICSNNLLEVSDATQDPRFFDNPYVTGESQFRFYAGQPIQSLAGNNLGTLCVIDRYSRELTPTQRSILKSLGKQVEHLLELRIRVQELNDSLQLIQQQKQALEEINCIKDRTLGVLVHDLRSPLSSLQGVLDCFDEDSLDVESTYKLIGSLRSNFQETRNQIESVLEWIDLQNKGKNSRWESLSVTSLLEKNLTWVQNAAIAKDIQLTLSCPENLRVKSDVQIINLVLRNLLANAIKFTAKGGKVMIFAEECEAKQEQKVRLGVTDTGIGINEKAMQQVIKQTLRFSTLGTAREKGSGLGLMLCQTYLIQINSSLEIKSQPNRGSTFSFLVDRDGDGVIQ